MSIRTGIGYDCHRLADGRRLILGGVELAHSRGLLGHSDADVLTHAVIDALLGAAGLGDLMPGLLAEGPRDPEVATNRTSLEPGSSHCTERDVRTSAGCCSAGGQRVIQRVR